MVSDFPNTPTNRMRFRLLFILPGVPSRSLDLVPNSVLISVDIAEYFEVENNFFDEDGLMLFAAVSCSIRSDLNRIQCYFEVTVPTYAPSEFRSRVKIGTFKLDPVPRKIWTHEQFQRGIPEAGSLFFLLKKCWHCYGRGKHTRSTLVKRRQVVNTTINRAEVLKRAWKQKIRSNGKEISDVPFRRKNFKVEYL